MDEWGYVIAVVVGIILSEVIRWSRDWREGKEKYKVMLYEKRLEAHQKAFSYVRQLMLRATTSYFSFAFDMDDKSDFDREFNNKEIKRLLLELNDFFDSNCLYLDEQSRSEIMRSIVVTGSAYDNFITENLSKEELTEKLKDSSDQLHKTQGVIVTGIGMKHIEKPTSRQLEG